MDKIEIIEKKDFQTLFEQITKVEQQQNNLRLKKAEYKRVKKENLKAEIKKLKFENKKNRSNLIAKLKYDYENDLELLNKSIEDEIIILQSQKSALKNQPKIKKEKETSEKKLQRTIQIASLKQKTKNEIQFQKELLKRNLGDQEKTKIIKQNIKAIKYNKTLAIRKLNEKVLFSPFVRFFKYLLDLIVRLGLYFKRLWNVFKSNCPNIAQFLVFFMLSNGVTILQLLLMPLIKAMLNNTDLVNISFQFGQIGKNIDGSKYYMFDYAKGVIVDGKGGGLAYFLSIQITLAIAQIINFFTQRNITFKSNSNPWIAAMWYLIAYLAITLIAAAAQGLYKAPIYNLLMNTWGLGSSGELIADFITMIINSAISFWVFFPIFKVIFKQVPEQEVV